MIQKQWHPTHNFELAQTHVRRCETNRAGGRFVPVGYENLSSQVKFQLGTGPTTRFARTFGAEYAAGTTPSSGLVMKVELTPDKYTFIEGFEAKTVEEANTHSQAWFGKPTPNAMPNSTIKEQNGDRPPCHSSRKIATEGKKRNGKAITDKEGKLSKETTGSVDDITPGSPRLAHRARARRCLLYQSRATMLLVGR